MNAASICPQECEKTLMALAGMADELAAEMEAEAAEERDDLRRRGLMIQAEEEKAFACYLRRRAARMSVIQH